MSINKYYLINKIIKLADALGHIGLHEQVEDLYRVSSSIDRGIIKNACIIASGRFDGKKCLFKNRDRNYLPRVRIYHTLIDGVEVVYMEDEITGWTEGMNEYGIGIVNSALAVAADEKEGVKKVKKSKKFEKDDDKTSAKRKKIIKNEERMLEALSKNNIKDAVNIIKDYLNGLPGHTIIATPNDTVSVEFTKESEKPYVGLLKEDKKHIRTNHGIHLPKEGYRPSDGVSYYSSHVREEQAIKIINTVNNPEDIAPSIYGKRFKKIDDPMAMVRDTSNMKTTSQMVLNLSDLEMLFYIIPDKVKFLGYKNELPKNYEPKIKVRVFKFSKIEEDGDFKTKEVKVSK